jgi:hypothetical protein
VSIFQLKFPKLHLPSFVLNGRRPRPKSLKLSGQGRLASGVHFNNARRMKNGNISSDIVLIAHIAERHWRAG